MIPGAAPATSALSVVRSSRLNESVKLSISCSSTPLTEARRTREMPPWVPAKLLFTSTGMPVAGSTTRDGPATRERLSVDCNSSAWLTIASE